MDWITRDYCKTNGTSLLKFRRKIEHKTGENVTNIEKLNKALKDKADDILKTKCKRRVIYEGKKEKEEAPSITEEIRMGIKERNRYNRLRRNATTKEEKVRHGNHYQEEKVKE